jgi:lipopolysaccharide/colanic/teichoic acid biosynthesis glycosyltransferase
MNVTQQIEEQCQLPDPRVANALAAPWPETATIPGFSSGALDAAGPLYPVAKRALDFVLSILLVAVLLPVFLLIVVIIRVTSPGAILFRQVRVGKGGRPFVMYKFRSMVADADSQVHMAAVDRFFNGSVIDASSSRTPFKLVNDPRVTWVGARLRKTSLDELPQLFNVIRGDMSLVGPRPALPYEVARYSEHDRERLTVPQGMTGLWQVKGRSRVGYREAFDLDIEYIRRRSLLLDVKILVLTLPAVILCRGGA